MSVLLHTASPASALLLSAALNARHIDPEQRRVLAWDSSTPGGAALEQGWAAGLWAHLAGARVDLAFSSPKAAMPDAAWPAPTGASSAAVGAAKETERPAAPAKAPSLLVLDPSAPTAASALAAAWPQSPVLAYGDGLSVLCPTPSALDSEVGLRATGLVHSELLPGLRPLMFTESRVSPETLDRASVQAALDPLLKGVSLPEPASHALQGKGRACLAVLQALPDLGKDSDAEAERLAARLVRAAQDGGTSALLLAPDPSASPALVARTQELAVGAGLRAATLPAWWPAELAHALVDPRLTVGVSAPALYSVQRLSGARVRSVATGRLLPRLRSAEDHARIVLAIVDATLRRGVPTPAEELSHASSGKAAPQPADPTRLQSVLDAVAYSVAPKLLAPLRDHTARTLRREPALRDAYISRKRVKKLHLLDRATPKVSALTGATLTALMPLATLASGSSPSGRRVR